MESEDSEDIAYEQHLQSLEPDTLIYRLNHHMGFRRQVKVFDTAPAL